MTHHSPSFSTSESPGRFLELRFFLSEGVVCPLLLGTINLTARGGNLVGVDWRSSKVILVFDLASSVPHHRSVPVAILCCRRNWAWGSCTTATAPNLRAAGQEPVSTFDCGGYQGENGSYYKCRVVTSSTKSTPFFRRSLFLWEKQHHRRGWWFRGSGGVAVYGGIGPDGSLLFCGEALRAARS